MNESPKKKYFTAKEMQLVIREVCKAMNLTNDYFAEFAFKINENKTAEVCNMWRKLGEIADGITKTNPYFSHMEAEETDCCGFVNIENDNGDLCCNECMKTIKEILEKY